MSPRGLCGSWRHLLPRACWELGVKNLSGTPGLVHQALPRPRVAVSIKLGFFIGSEPCVLGRSVCVAVGFPRPAGRSGVCRLPWEGVGSAGNAPAASLVTSGLWQGRSGL